MTDKKRGKERYEILFEDINSKMDLVLEGYSEFGNKLNEAKQERDAIKDDLTEKIEFVAGSLNKKLDEAKKERQAIRSDLTEKIEFVASSLNNKTEEVRVDLGRRIEGTEKRLEEKIGKIGYKLDAHEERIEVIEKKVSI